MSNKEEKEMMRKAYESMLHLLNISQDIDTLKAALYGKSAPTDEA